MRRTRWYRRSEQRELYTTPTEMVTRQERAINHTAEHIGADLTRRVETLEKAGEKPPPKSRKK